jgi:hypothetical protein
MQNVAPHVVAFAGTAIRDGLVSRMCSRVLEGAADAGASTELLNLYDHEIEHCIGCWSCYRVGTCFHDDDEEALFTKLRTLRRELGRFGPRYESMRGKSYVLITVSTLPFPCTALTGQTRLALSALGALPQRLDGRVLARIVDTDSLLRCLEGKEARVMRPAYRTGQLLAHRVSV